MPANFCGSQGKGVFDHGCREMGGNASAFVRFDSLNSQFIAPLVGKFGQAPANEPVIISRAEAEILPEKVFK